MNKSKPELIAEFIGLLDDAKKKDPTVYNLAICMILDYASKRNENLADNALWNYACSLSKGELKRIIKCCRQAQSLYPDLAEDYECYIFFIRESLMKKPAQLRQV